MSIREQWYENSYEQKRNCTRIISSIYSSIYLVLTRRIYIKTGLSLRPFDDLQILSIVTTLFVVAIFMERSIEAILIPIRRNDQKKIEFELRKIKEIKTEDERKIDLEKKKEMELEVYKRRTEKYAAWGGFMFGLFISVAGVRALAGLFDPMDLDRLEGHHSAVFSFVDIVFTGGVIGGGSAAIDKIGRGISDFYKLRSEADPKPTTTTRDAPTPGQ